jgi:hypothetical protein
MLIERVWVVCTENLIRVADVMDSPKLLYGFVIVRIERRELVWINVTTNPTAEWIARQITEAFPWDGAPGYMIRDRDRIYGAVVTRRLRAMGRRHAVERRLCDRQFVLIGLDKLSMTQKIRILSC